MHDKICPICCGQEREVTLDCPSDCVYLQEARKHERRPLKELPGAVLFGAVEIRDQFLFEHEALLTGLTFALAKAARSDRALRDGDLIDALTSIAERQQTLVHSGLHVDGATASGATQAVIHEIDATLAEYRKLEEKHRGYSALRDSELLQAFVFLVRMAHMRTSGRPRSRAFVDFLAEQFPETKDTIVTPAQSSRIVIP